MTMRNIIALTSGIAMLPGAAFAQAALEYEIGGYEYAEPLPEEVAEEEVKPRIVLEPTEERVAQRAIEARQDGTAPTFVERPILQPLRTVDPDRTGVIGTTAAGADFAHDSALQAPVTYTDAPPVASGAIGSTVTPMPAPVDRSDAGRTYVYRAGQEPRLPLGGRIVQFDRAAWLQECSRRLAPQRGYTDNSDEYYDYDEIEYDPERSNAATRRCETYLDSYMASSRSGGLQNSASPTGDYMLVPVTVMQMQQARYSDGTPVRARD
ncbi:hypothetical protein Q9K02_01195 [Qipengyuania sp. G39]|uniref:Uncharacterized protein n=1 Tax=Qipengyuania profundimaris TaxID=3067652 RepID=A0ABT9HLK0_9SPHN|nr:hypothetical protein [Qipengyuania sp. G39]MDP4573752.1 hypothetical protein [Qipengyuania sp. G39]